MKPSRALVCLLAYAIPTAVLRADDAHLPTAKPETLGVSSERLDRIDGVVNQAIDRGDLPGAVVLVGHRGHVVFRKAYGLRSKQPEKVAMTTDTVFDLASLTKPVATATSIMLLVEEGKLSVSDPVAKHLPAFAAKGKDKITVENLLLHTSGLIADNPVADYKDGKKKALERICELEPQSEPGTRFVYSDVNYILLGEIVERLTETPLNEFAQKHIFKPLGMMHATFRQPLPERFNADMAKGYALASEPPKPYEYVVPAPAGSLAASGDDMAKFMIAHLNDGVLNGQRILAVTRREAGTSDPLTLVVNWPALLKR